MTATHLAPSSFDEHDAFVRLLDKLELNAADVGRAMATTIQQDLATYAAVARHDPTFRTRFTTHCEQHVRTFVTTTREGRVAGFEDLEFVREVGVRRADDAFPLAALLQGMQVGHRVLSARIAQLAASVGSSSAALWLTGKSIDYLEAISAALAESYQARQQLVMGRAELTRRQLLDDLLEGRYVTRPDAAALASSMGFEPDAQYCVGVLIPAGPRGDGVEAERRAQMLAADVTRAAFASTSFRFVVVRRDEVVAALRAIDAAEVLARARAAAQAREQEGLSRAGLSTPCKGIVEVPRGYWEAVRALSFASRNQPCVDLREMGVLPYLTASADALAQRLATQCAGILAASQVGGSGKLDTLARTIVTYVACDLNASHAAEKLGVHLNTIHNRLERVAELLQRPELGPAQLVELAAAIRICQMHPPRT